MTRATAAELRMGSNVLSLRKGPKTNKIVTPYNVNGVSVFLVQRGSQGRMEKEMAFATCVQWLCLLLGTTIEVRFCWLS